MAVVVTSIKHYDEFTSTGGGGTRYFNGRICDKMRTEIEFYVKWSCESARLTFAAADDTITWANNYSYNSFIENGFKVGDTITVSGTSLNNGNWTITAVTETTITVSGALTDETAEAGNIYGVTAITTVDLFYNLIKKSADYSYDSLTDEGTQQRFYADGLDASNVTPVNMEAGGISNGWLTASGTTIQGVSIANYKQSFKIIQYYTVAPFYLDGQEDNFERILPPDYFKDLESLKYIYRIDAKVNAEQTDSPHTYEDESIGTSAWFNASNQGRRPNYTLTSITYTNPSAVVVDSPDFNESTDVTLVIASDALFTNNSYIILHFFRCPASPDEYQNTGELTLHENYWYDRKKLQVATGGHGDNNGGDYQVLTNISVVKDSASQITITFKLNLSTYLKGLLEDMDETNRRFAIAVSTQDPTIATTTNVDRVTILADYNEFDYDQDDNTLLELVDYAHCFHYPNIGIAEANNIAGYEGDPVYVMIPFRVETTETNGVSPTLQKVGLSVVAQKANNDDFILEQTILDTTAFRKLNGVQTIYLASTRGFKTYDGDPYNEIKLTNEEAYTSGTKKGYVLTYGMVLNYAFWSTKVPLMDGKAYDVFKDVQWVSDAWKYFEDAGWSLKLNIEYDVEGYDGYTTTFKQQVDIDLKGVGEVPSAGTNFDATISYQVEDENGDLQEVNGIKVGGQTLIRAVFTGDTTTMPTGFDGFYGYIFMDCQYEGGITERKFCSTAIASESSSPFSAPDEEDGATSSETNGNARINYFTNKIVVSSWYDDTKDNWTTNRRMGSILTYPRLGYKPTNYDCVRLLEDGTPRLIQNGTARTLENCP